MVVPDLQHGHANEHVVHQVGFIALQLADDGPARPHVGHARADQPES